VPFTELRFLAARPRDFGPLPIFISERGLGGVFSAVPIAVSAAFGRKP
jgi:hypothetical protein